VATAEAGVCNRALLRIGQSQLINDLTQASPIARACQALYADSRDATLEARWWPFAKRRATLAEIAEADLPEAGIGGWAYAYTLPADCIAPRYIEALTDDTDEEVIAVNSDAIGIASGARPIPFDTEDDGDRRILLTDQPAAVLVYTARVTQVARFTPLFKDALSFKLASDLAFGIAKKPAVGREMLVAFERALERAAGSSAKQSKPRSRPRSAFERVR
jgi:hypothetical protein